MLCFCFAVIMLVSLAGCGKRNVSGNRVTLRYVTYEYMPSQIKVQQNIIDAFNSSQDRITVKMEVAERTEKILVQLAGGKSSAPDVFLCYSGDVNTMAEKGAILQLDPLVKASGIKKSDYFPQLFETLTANPGKKLYAFPTSWASEALAYNIDLFDKAGVAYPDASWTWDDFRKAAQKLTIQENGRVTQYGASTVPEHIIMNSFGAKFFSDDMTKCNMNAPEIKAAFQYIIDLDRKYKVVPSMASQPRQEQLKSGLDMFLTRRVGMYIVTSFQLEALSKVNNLRWDVAPIPRYEGKKRIMSPGVNTLVIYSGTAHPKEAWEFIKFFSGPVGQRMLGKNCVPARRDIANKYFLQPPPKHLRVMIDQYEGINLNTWAGTTWGNQYLREVYSPKVDELLLGLTTVDNAIQIMQTKGEKYMKSAKK